MPPPSDATLRYKIIDECLTNIYKPFPTMDHLKYTIERELKTSVSTATIQKDIAQMKKGEDEGGYSAPIKFKRSNQGYYYDFVKFPDFTIQYLSLKEKESGADLIEIPEDAILFEKKLFPMLLSVKPSSNSFATKLFSITLL